MIMAFYVASYILVNISVIRNEDPAITKFATIYQKLDLSVWLLQDIFDSIFTFLS